MLAPLFILPKLFILLKMLLLPPPIPRLLKAKTETGRFVNTWVMGGFGEVVTSHETAAGTAAGTAAVRTKDGGRT